MLDYNKLSTQIINAIENKTDTKQIHDLLGIIISKHLMENLEIQGSYTGMIPGTPPVPDPLNGIVNFNLLISAIKGSQLLKGAKVNLDTWYNFLCFQINLTSIINQTNGSVALTSPNIIFTKIRNSNLNLKDIKQFKQIWKEFSKVLINDIKNTKPVSVPFPAISSTGGIGTIIFSTFN